MSYLRAFAAVAALATVQVVSAWEIDLPSCQTGTFTPFTYSGCYSDTGDTRALVYRSNIPTQGMTLEICAADCKGQGYRYAGLEYYGVCFCGASIGGSMLDDSQCNLPCDGNNTETCGGNSNLSVWQDPTFPPNVDDVMSIGDYSSAGCYSDNSNLGRAVAHSVDIAASDFTPANCMMACKAGGYAFAGVEYGSQCYCGPVLGNFSTALDSSACNMACSGDSTQTCGGSSALNLYIAKDLESTQPCSSFVPPPPSSSTSSSATSSATTVPASSVPATTPASSSAPATTPASSSTPVYSSPSSSSPASSVPTTTPVYSAPSSSSTPVSSVPTTTPVYSAPTSSLPVSIPTTTPAYSVPTSTLLTSTLPTTAPSSSSPVSSVPSSTPVSSVPTSTPISTTPVKSSSTTTPPVTTKPPTSSPPATTALCTSTVTVPSTCEYGCGKWCADALPDWNSADACTNGHSQCKLQIADCFQNAGWPDAMKCFDFSSWCGSINNYCGVAKTGGKCSKSDCFNKNPPQNNKPGVTKTTVYACPVTTGKASVSTKPASTSTSVTKCPIPSVTNICQQPSSKQYGYGPGKPVGGIELPIVTCNDLKVDYDAGNQFKLYTSKDTSSCKSYKRPQCGNACADACKAQYDQCSATYVTGCKSNNGGRARFARAETPEARALQERTWGFGWTDNTSTANSKCYTQYQDCLSENKSVNISNKCGAFGQGFI